MNVPILFLVFNRPETTLKVFEQIRKVKPKYLYVAADGPRINKVHENERCAEARKIATAVDWDCEIHTLFRNENLGCGKAVSSAISWFFEHVEEGIILEDDCLPDLSFFNFCTILLEKYRNAGNVKIISGNNFQAGKLRGNNSYYFSAFSHIWGWATWRHVWREYDFSLDTIDIEHLKERLSTTYSFNKEMTNYWIGVYKTMKQKKIDTWDYQLQFSIWNKEGVCIIPNENLVSNIGFGEGATHTISHDSLLSNLKASSILKFDHPHNILIQKEADQYTFNTIIYKKPSMLINFIRKIKSAISVIN